MDELNRVLDLAVDFKAKRAAGEATLVLQGKTLYMIFFDASTRTRNSFETGITQLGGHGIYLVARQDADQPRRKRQGHGQRPLALR